MELFRERFATYAEMGTTFGLIACMEQWAAAGHRIMRDPLRAVHLYAAAEMARGRSGAARQGGAWAQSERERDEPRHMLGDVVFQAEWAIGAARARDDLVASSEAGIAVK